MSSKSLLTNNINNSRETFVHTSFNNSHFSFWRKLCVQRFNKYTANRFLFWVSITQKILRMVSLISNDRACWRTLPQQNLRILKRHRLYETMCRMLLYSETFPSEFSGSHIYICIYVILHINNNLCDLSLGSVHFMVYEIW